MSVQEWYFLVLSIGSHILSNVSNNQLLKIHEVWEPERQDFFLDEKKDSAYHPTTKARSLGKRRISWKGNTKTAKRRSGRLEVPYCFLFPVVSFNNDLVSLEFG